MARFSMAFKILREKFQIFRSCWMSAHCEINEMYLLCTDILPPPLKYITISENITPYLLFNLFSKTNFT